MTFFGEAKRLGSVSTAQALDWDRRVYTVTPTVPLLDVSLPPANRAPLNAGGPCYTVLNQAADGSGNSLELRDNVGRLLAVVPPQCSATAMLLAGNSVAGSWAVQIRCNVPLTTTTTTTTTTTATCDDFALSVDLTPAGGCESVCGPLESGYCCITTCSLVSSSVSNDCPVSVAVVGCSLQISGSAGCLPGTQVCATVRVTLSVYLCNCTICNYQECQEYEEEHCIVIC